MKFFEAPLYNEDVINLLLHFAVNLLVVTLIVRLVYCKCSTSKEFLFTYYMINILVFFICFTLKKYDLGIGMALGLFAIFGILRYRTETIPIKEMTYLFVVIGVAVINALSNQNMSYTELAFTNVTILLATAVLENLLLNQREMSEQVLYERIDLLKPERHAELVADLEERTGLSISRIELGQINFLQDTVQIDVYYHPIRRQSAPGEAEVTRMRRFL